MSDNTKADLRAASMLVGDILAESEDEAIAQRVREEQARRQEAQAQRHARGWFLVAELVELHARQRGWTAEMAADSHRAARMAAGDGSLPVREFPEGFPEPAASTLRWCELSDFNDWLVTRKVKPLTLPQDAPGAPAVAVPEPVARPLQRQRHQEAEILRVLRELGHDPHALPRNTPGRAGPKAAAFGRLGWKKGERGVFDKAWDRLRQARDIADA